MGQVHRLDALFRQRFDVEGRDRLNVAEEVAQQVDAVDGVFDEGAAAEFVAAGPVANRLAAVEVLDLGVARSALLQQLQGRRGRRLVAIDEADLGYDAGFFNRGVEFGGLR